MTAQAEMELRRSARSKYGNSAEIQARRTASTVSRLVGHSGPQFDDEPRQRRRARPVPQVHEHTSVGMPNGRTIAKGAAITAGIGITGGGFAVAGVADVLAAAASPMFIGVGLAAAAVTYTAGELLDAQKAKSHFQLVVDEVEIERPGIVSAHLSGINLEDLPLVAGQSAEWTFSDGDLKRHPIRGYLSCVPREGLFRVMFMVDENTCNALRMTPSGARVTVKHPDGLSPDMAGGRSLIVASGPGIIPGRGLFESIPGGAGEVAMIYRATTPSSLMMVEELKEIGSFRQARLSVAVGPPAKFPRDKQPLSGKHLTAVAPDIRFRDVYVAGPKRMVSSVTTTLRRLGVPVDQIHPETF